MDSPSFDGRTVVVTGASGGLGSAVAHAFTAAGATVVPVARSGPGVPVDLTDDAQVAAFVDGLAGPPGGVLHRVGGWAPAGPLRALDQTELQRQLTLNLVSSALVVKHALRVMTPAGAGRIVLTAS